jgi:hypothetical protein
MLKGLQNNLKYLLLKIYKRIYLAEMQKLKKA